MEINYPILAIDYGKRHVGLAYSDSKGLIASPLKTVHLPAENDLLYLKKILSEAITEYRIKSILVGMPQQFEENTESQRKILNFIKLLETWSELPIVSWDESFSTKRAENMLVSTGQKLKKARKKIDSIACAIFLQEFLNYNHKNNEKDN